MMPDIAVAVSGGIDSLMGARLLKKQGHSVVGIHFITGYASEGRNQASRATSGTVPDALYQLAQRTARHIAAQVEMPVYVLDLRQAFERHVIAYFTRTYQQGRTPNPCLACNPLIKFGEVLRFAQGLGAARLATGHYARVSRDAQGRLHLLKGLDPLKDQSYFLAFLQQDQLALALFPLGSMHKQEIIRTAGLEGLQPAIQDESQDVCFIPRGRYAQFLARRKGFRAQPGPIEDLAGRRLGEHRGLHRYTIGQRRGINLPAARPYYVVRLEPQRNCLVVGSQQDLLVQGCRVEAINWIQPPPAQAISIDVRLRYRHQSAPARLEPMPDRRAVVCFDQPQAAVTPGQGAVFYLDDEVLGGGWIARAWPC